MKRLERIVTLIVYGLLNMAIFVIVAELAFSDALNGDEVPLAAWCFGTVVSYLMWLEDRLDKPTD